MVENKMQLKKEVFVRSIPQKEYAMKKVTKSSFSNPFRVSQLFPYNFFLQCWIHEYFIKIK